MQAQTAPPADTSRPVSTWRVRTFGATRDTLQLDTLPVVLPSVSVWYQRRQLPDSMYSIFNNRLTLRFLPSDSVQVRYRVLPAPLYQLRAHKPRTMIGTSGNLANAILGADYKYNPYRANAVSDALDFKGLDYSGNFSRGISVGNKQDLVLNSNFNLQLSGKVGDVEIMGAITDNNIPLQPDGNTQQLQDFDRVFVQFRLPRNALIAGDYNLSNPDASYFSKYNRRLQGGRLLDSLRLGKHTRLVVSNAFALARGKFARNVIQGQEGNQGAYKLTGNNGERYIIIIAGTEKVFIDGKMLTRGAENDYIIDYNLGEVRFTNKCLITKDKRIQVEFTYTDANYVRTLYDLQAELRMGNINLRFQHFSEQDARNQSANQVLNDTTRAILQTVGDSVGQAYTSGLTRIDRSAATGNLLLYKLVDSVVQGNLYDSVLVYAPTDTNAVYTVQFSAVSSGSANYVRVSNGSNGAVYQWVAPDALTGASRGTHAPVALLIAPKQQQLTTLGIDIELPRKGVLSADIARSNNDANTFSTVGNADNAGMATRITYQQKFSWRAVSRDTASRATVGNSLQVGAHYEYVQARFQPLEPYRAREFARDWNTTNLAKTNEHWGRWSAALQWGRLGSIGYEGSILQKDTIYTGLKNEVKALLNWHGIQLNANTSLLTNSTATDKGVFVRPRVDLRYTAANLHNIQTGIYWEREKNELRNHSTDSLQSGSFHYDVFKAYVTVPTIREKFAFQLNAQRRYDYARAGRVLAASTTADEANASGKWTLRDASNLEFNLNYRNLRINDSTLTTEIPLQTYVGRLEYNAQVKRGFIRWNTIYEVGGGQQQKYEYNYVKTDIGLGTHIWIDRNEDGVQQQGEFEVAVFQDQADYIRVTVLSSEFVRTQNVAFSQSIDLTPKILLSKYLKGQQKATFLAFVAKLSARSVWRTERKTFAGLQKLPFNPFQFNISDTALVSMSHNVQNSVFFNRSGTNFSMELSQLDSRTANLLSNGVETRLKSEYSLTTRLKVGKKLLTTLTTTLGTKGNTSELFAERDYRIRLRQIEPAATYMHKTNLRLLAKYAHKYQWNTIGAGETSEANSLTMELTYNKAGAWNIRSQLSYVKLRFVGATNTAIQFAMVDGLQSGDNFLWTLALDKALSANIQFTLSYEGRKTGSTNVVHVGRAQIRAVF